MRGGGGRKTLHPIPSAVLLVLVLWCLKPSPPPPWPACRCCAGRIVSVLEGGYNLRGGLVSAFARSVASHVRVLMEPHSATWDPQDSQVPACYCLLLPATTCPLLPACLLLLACLP